MSKTDTLDAIAREKHVKALAEWLHGENVDTVTFTFAVKAALTALSNQGEGAVAWIEPGTLNACSAAEFEEVRRAYPGIYANWFPVYLHPAEADRRDAERIPAIYDKQSDRAVVVERHDWPQAGPFTNVWIITATQEQT